MLEVRGWILVFCASLLGAISAARADSRWPPLDSREPCEAVAAYRLISDGPIYSIPWDKLDGEKAAEICRQSLGQNPDSDRLKFLLSRALLKAGRFADAADLLDALSAKSYLPADVLLARAITEGWIAGRAPGAALPLLLERFPGRRNRKGDSHLVGDVIQAGYWSWRPA
jgi:hypothetical protein